MDISYVAMGIVLVPEAKHTPRVSIGLPVYNGERYIEAAIDSILTQTYCDLELIIVDNASTDQTPRICREYAAKDKRIRYYRNKINMGVVANFNRAFKFSSGEYFKWAAHDDVLAPEFLSKCINILDNDPSIVLCHSKTGCIDEHGKLVGIYNYNVKTDLLKSHERFGDFVLRRYQDDSWILIFGLMRADVLRKTELMGKFIGSDINLLAEISLIGRIYEVPEVLFFRRSHPQAFSNRASAKKLEHQEIVFWVQSYRFSSRWWRICIEYFKSVKRSPLNLSERLLSYAQILKWIAKVGWISMVDEVGIYFLTRSRLGIKLAPFVKRIRNFHKGEVK
ncbi:MAG: glycosyltransferase family 2 protein [Dehalococcoidia bacterium]|nr:MAG: glycosyltransferase family 2 protein [Dehalococcoidia bacterium]